MGRRLYFLVGAGGFLRGVFFSLFSPALPQFVPSSRPFNIPPTRIKTPQITFCPPPPLSFHHQPHHHHHHHPYPTPQQTQQAPTSPTKLKATHIAPCDKHRKYSKAKIKNERKNREEKEKKRKKKRSCDIEERRLMRWYVI